MEDTNIETHNSVETVAPEQENRDTSASEEKVSVEENLTYKQRVSVLESQMLLLQKELEDSKKSLESALGESKLYKGSAKLGLIDEEGFELAKHFYAKTGGEVQFDEWLSQSIQGGTLPKGLSPYINSLQVGTTTSTQSKPPPVQNHTTSQRASEQERLDLVKRANSPHTTAEEKIRIINLIKSYRN